MERKQFIKEVDNLSDRELRQLFNFIFVFFDENENTDRLEEEIENIKQQRKL